MSFDGGPALTPGLFGRVASGVFGGLAGGVVFGVLMQVTGTIPLVAQLVEQDSLVVGWAVHMSIAAFVGVTHALIFGAFAVTLPISTLLGVFYGLIWWILGGLTLMPLRLGMGLFVFDAAAWQSLAGHLAYGVVLGVVYAMVARSLRRAEHQEAPDSGEQHPGEQRPGGQQPGTWRLSTPQPGTWPAAAAAYRPGLTPLSPQARALRQRRRTR